MSLQVWLPLNEDLHNQGLSNLTFSVYNNSSGLTISNNGKISNKCYERTAGSNNAYRSNTTIKLDGDISIACWAYITKATSTSANGLITNHSHNDNSGIGLNIKYISDSDYRISCSTGDGTSRTYDRYYGITNIKNAWHHLAITYSKILQRLQLWVDGNIEYTLENYNNKAIEDYIDIFGWSTSYEQSSQYRAWGKLNDVRIYDHALSPKEIKEIAKGLCLHYRLSAIGQENFISSFVEGGNTTINGYEVVIPGRTVGSDTYFQTVLSKTLEKNKQYVLSFDTEFDVKNILEVGNFNLTFNSYTGTSLGVRAPIIDIPRHYEIPFTCSIADAKLIFWDDVTKTVCSTDIIIKNLKVEEGTVATPWLPNPNDAIYSTLGLNSKTEPDCSGYGNNGTKVGNIVANADTARYSTSYYLPDKNSYVVAQTGKGPNPTDAISLSIWFNATNIAGSETALLANVETGGAQLVTNGSKIILFVFLSGGYRQCVAPGPYDNGKWYHAVGTYDGTNLKIYINGKLVNTVAYAGYPIHYNATAPWAVGMNPGPNGENGGANFIGKLSDARVYATALSAEDVLDLYQTGASVDNGGNIYAYDFIEGGA